MGSDKKQRDPRALDHSPESWHMRRLCFGLCLKRYFIISSGGYFVQKQKLSKEENSDFCGLNLEISFSKSPSLLYARKSFKRHLTWGGGGV